MSPRADLLLMLTKTAGTTNWSEAHERAGIDDAHASARSGKISVSAGKADICAAWDAPTALRGPAAAELRGAKLPHGARVMATHPGNPSLARALQIEKA